MKKLILKVVMSLLCIAPITAMERPPLTPVKNQKSVHALDSDSVYNTPTRRVKPRIEDQKENEVRTGIARLSLEGSKPVSKEEAVTPNGRALRVGIIRKTIACIEGIDEKRVGNPEIHPKFLSDSPVRLKARMHAVATQDIYTACQKFGITREKIKACYPAALSSARTSSFLAKIMNPLVSIDLENEMKEMAIKLGRPDFFVRSDAHAYFASNYHDAVLINEQDLRTLSPELRAVVFAHEITHGIHFDAVFGLSVWMAFNKEGKDADFLHAIQPKLRRSCEVFADMGAAVSSPTLAKNLAALRAHLHAKAQQDLQKNGMAPVTASSHPESGAWAELDKQYIALHEKDRQEKERMVRMALASQRFNEQLEKEHATK